MLFDHYLTAIRRQKTVNGGNRRYMTESDGLVSNIMLTAMIQVSGATSQSEKSLMTCDDRTRLRALSLISDCYKYIMDLTIDVVVVRFHCNHTVLYETQAVRMKMRRKKIYFILHATDVLNRILTIFFI